MSRRRASLSRRAASAAARSVTSDPCDEDSGDRAVAVLDRLINEVDQMPASGTVRARLERDGGAEGRIDLAGPENIVEQFEKSLAFEIRERRANGTANQVASPDEVEVGLIGQLEDMVSPAKHRHETRRLLEELRHMLDIFGRPAPQQDLLGRFGAHHQDAADAIGRIFVVDGSVAIGPVDLLEPAVPGDRDQGVFLPGGAAPAHDLLDLRAR